MSYSYNGDGALVSETQGLNTRRYLLDPTGGQFERLSRTANDTTTAYLNVPSRVGACHNHQQHGALQIRSMDAPTNPASSYGFFCDPQLTAIGGVC